MAILKVARMGHPVLRTSTRELTRGQVRSGEIQRLIDDMIDTMREYDGVGLAAPQVHAGVRLAVVAMGASGEGEEDAPGFTVLVNPVVTPIGTNKALGWEGCLSIPDLRGEVPRHTEIAVEALDRQGRAFRVEAADFFARVIQHECDHLDGVLYVDRMQDMRSLTFIREFERFVGPEAGPVED
jgi:peptide deformylase